MLVDDRRADREGAALSIALASVAGTGEAAVWRFRAGRLIFALTHAHIMEHGIPPAPKELCAIYRQQRIGAHMEHLAGNEHAPELARRIARDFIAQPDNERGSITAEVGNLLETIAQDH